MSIYATRSQLGNRWAEHQCELMGLRPDDPNYAEMLKLAETRCAWQVAEMMQASPDVVATLGAPIRVVVLT